MLSELIIVVPVTLVPSDQPVEGEGPQGAVDPVARSIVTCINALVAILRLHQMAADPALAAAFRKKVATDAEFAKSPRARLEFFARRHPSWDERLNLYPVMRIAVAPAGTK